MILVVVVTAHYWVNGIKLSVTTQNVLEWGHFGLKFSKYVWGIFDAISTV